MRSAKPGNHLNHQSCLLQEGQSCITFTSIIEARNKRKKNRAGSGFRRKKGWDSGIKKKKQAGPGGRIWDRM